MIMVGRPRGRLKGSVLVKVMLLEKIKAVTL